ELSPGQTAVHERSCGRQPLKQRAQSEWRAQIRANRSSAALDMVTSSDNICRIAKSRRHETKQRVAVERHIRRDRHEVPITRDVDAAIERIAVSGASLVDHHETWVASAAVDATDFGRVDDLAVEELSRLELPVARELVDQALRCAVGHHDDLELGIVQVEEC